MKFQTFLSKNTLYLTCFKLRDNFFSRVDNSLKARRLNHGNETTKTMNRTVIKSIARDMHATARELDRVLRGAPNYQSRRVSKSLKGVADRLLDLASINPEKRDPMEAIATLSDGCHSLDSLTKLVSGTPYERRLRIFTFELLNTTPDLMADIIKPVPKNSYLFCSTKKTLTN